ncbi:MAG: hypothetical protein KGI98_05650 [Euryarchaeota archaeon]|nr:hypothetical protein [Euryarchaeota archaeon]
MSEHARRIRSTRTAQPIPFASPPGVHWEGPDLVSLRAFKESLEFLPPTHPLRIILSTEPDDIPTREYAAKIVGWHRLLKLPVG